MPLAMRWYVALVGLGLLAGSVVTGCPSESKSPPPPPPPPPQPATQKAPPPQAKAPPRPTGPMVEAGKRLYLTACSNCHGMDGTGSMMRQMMPNIGNLTDPATHARLSDDDLKKLITSGRNKMPAFGTIFKPNQVDQIIAYTRTLRK